MTKRHQLHKQIFKDLKAFRERQRNTIEADPIEIKDEQSRELEQILSPFWAWRSRA